MASRSLSGPLPVPLLALVSLDSALHRQVSGPFLAAIAHRERAILAFILRGRVSGVQAWLDRRSLVGRSRSCSAATWSSAPRSDARSSAPASSRTPSARRNSVQPGDRYLGICARSCTAGLNDPRRGPVRRQLLARAPSWTSVYRTSVRRRRAVGACRSSAAPIPPLRRAGCTMSWTSARSRFLPVGNSTRTSRPRSVPPAGHVHTSNDPPPSRTEAERNPRRHRRRDRVIGARRLLAYRVALRYRPVIREIHRHDLHPSRRSVLSACSRP